MHIQPGSGFPAVNHDGARTFFFLALDHESDLPVVVNMMESMGVKVTVLWTPSADAPRRDRPIPPLTPLCPSCFWFTGTACGAGLDMSPRDPVLAVLEHDPVAQEDLQRCPLLTKTL